MSSANTAQTEDTELRDLVIEALEKNGSLAKIRALLRANVFLVFEDEGQNLKQNASLDNILKMPEGALCLSIIHEFLEFCNLKNTLFVYMAESRQGNEYKYEGKKKITSKLNLTNRDSVKEPILYTLLKQLLQNNQKKYYDQGDCCNIKSGGKSGETNFKDDQNCTYIVHEDSISSTTSNSQSENSSDEKNKLHLRLQLENSDTDTSSDSAREKSCSEYIPNEHIIQALDHQSKSNVLTSPVKHEKQSNIFDDINTGKSYLQELKLVNANSSSDSTSYLDLKPYNRHDENMINTPGVPILEVDEKEISHLSASINVISRSPEKTSINDTHHRGSLNKQSHSETVSSSSIKNVKVKSKTSNLSIDKSDVESPEYSNDFVTSSGNKNKGDTKSPSSLQVLENKEHTNNSFESPRQSSQSSVSISDVADLVSEKSSLTSQHNNEKSPGHNSTDKVKKVVINDKSKSDDSAEFSESTIPSLSNLSLDIHSD